MWVKTKMINSKEVEILGIKLNQKRSFYKHIKNISKIAGQIETLLRFCTCLEDNKIKVICNTMLKF